MDGSSTPRSEANRDNNITTTDAILSLADLLRTSSTKTNGNAAPAAIHSLLPPEIMAEIFMTVCDYIPRRRPPRVTSPLVLGKVCGAWRKICWSIPSLWEVIDLLVVPVRLNVQNELLEEWISRAGSRNLHIYLNEEEPYRGWRVPLPQKIMHTIGASFSRKWETAGILLPEDNYADLIPIKDNLPVLKSLSIRPPKGKIIEIDLRIFENCPLLRSLDLGRYYLDNLFLPWKQLTILYADRLLIEECFRVFCECRNLITCHLDMVTSENEDIVTHPVPITHSGIESFDVTSSEVQEIASVFGSVTLPALRKLQITCSNWTEDTTPALLASFFSRSSCNLHSLILNNIFQLETYLIQILDALPSLIHLNVEERDFHFSKNFLDFLHRADSHRLFLPNLQALTLCGMFSFTIHDMHGMLEGRRKHQQVNNLLSGF